MFVRTSSCALLCVAAALGSAAQLPAAEPTSVTFSQRPAVVGDQAELSMHVEVQLKTTARDGQQVIDQSETSLHRQQQRLMTTTQIAAKPDGRQGASAARVEYRKAVRTMAGAKPIAEPVEGHAYFCKRDGEKLRVVTPEGDLPPIDQYAIVAQNMETFGQENPLAKFFAGRTIALGQTMQLPQELAGQLLGMQDQIGDAQKFTLKLVELKTIDEQPCAVFKTVIEAGGQDAAQATTQAGPQMVISVSGVLVMQVNACRAVQAELAGPIGMSETRRSGGSAVQVTGLGNLRVAIRTKYRDAR